MRHLRYLLIVTALLTIVLVGCGHNTSKVSLTSASLFLKLNNKIEINDVDLATKQLMNYLHIEDSDLIHFNHYSVNHNYMEFDYDHTTYAVNAKDYTIIKWSSNPDDPLGGSSYEYYKATCELPGVNTKQYSKVYNKQFIDSDGSQKESIAAQYIVWLPEMEETNEINKKINQKLRQYNQELLIQFDTKAKEYLEDKDLQQTIKENYCIPAAYVYNLNVKYYITKYDEERISFLISGYDYDDWEVAISFSAKTGEMLKSNIGESYRVLNLEPVKCNQESTNKNVADVKKEFSLKEDQIMTIDYNKLIAKSDYEIFSKFKVDDVDFYDNAYLLDFQQSDVNGDKIEDNILMTGVHEEDFSSPYHDNITLIIQDGKSKKLMFLSPKNAHGYGYSFSMGDFNGDKVKDILVSVNNDMTGGAGQYTHSIYSLKDNRLNVLFDNEKIREEINLKVMFMDNFNIKISLPQLTKKIIVDKSDQRKKYKELNLYKGNKLRKKTEGSADNYCSLVPKDVNKDGILELRGMQYISGYGHSDGLGMAISILKYNNKRQKWIVKDMEFEAFDD